MVTSGAGETPSDSEAWANVHPNPHTPGVQEGALPAEVRFPTEALSQHTFPVSLWNSSSNPLNVITTHANAVSEVCRETRRDL